MTRSAGRNGATMAGIAGAGAGDEDLMADGNTDFADCLTGGPKSGAGDACATIGSGAARAVAAEAAAGAGGRACAAA